MSRRPRSTASTWTRTAPPSRPRARRASPASRPDNATERDRNNFGLYADAETDLTPKLLANVAARFESYNDFGEQLSGKVALRYQPSRRLVFRGAAGTGFRAPGLSQVSFNKVVTNVIADQFVEVGIFPVDDPAALALGAQPLKEETSINLSAGLAFTPMDNLTVTADVFHIDIDDRIILGATFDDDATLALLADAGVTGIGGVQYFTNGVDTRTQGIDVTGSWRIPTGERGTLDLTGSVNYTQNEIRHVDSIPQVLRDAGSTEPGLLDTVTVIAIEDERPDWRTTLQANYTLGRVSALGRYSYYGGFSSAQPGFCDLCRENYGGKSLVDAELGYQFDMVKLAVGVRNLFDTYPDQPSSEVVVADGREPLEGLQQQLRDLPLGRGLAVRVQRTVRLREDGDSVDLVGGRASEPALSSRAKRGILRVTAQDPSLRSG